ncbi:hypothetical protein GUJ93_ZPchr0012g21254 [Zizania palustris]|uniref:Spindle pole body-associated protein Vik1/Cik1 microtubule binding domain-containing protein n=1 Tax=Zizania palustris TaxID=103762 RepID=A0A8J5WTK5_ZIZPA|nr:hypothetical protein GUJ93_ZPchr0012g21254 [Zizania palustris]
MELSFDCNDVSEEISALRSRQRHLDHTKQEALDKLIDLKGSIRIFCRIIVRTTGIKKEFNADRVFDQESTQEDIFQEVKPILKSALGGHVCIHAYGQTGIGKNTMSISVDDSSDVVYISGEESIEQIVNRADRMCIVYKLFFSQVWNCLLDSA